MANETDLPTPFSNIIPINIEDEMRTAYIDYSMSVIVSRAIPDVRDGLKPVHRRVLFGMSELGVYHNKAYKKSARIVGDVLGKYHPHGDASVYDTLVRMAQPWSLRYPLVDGQGNFGSVDGDSPASMRYTEARLSRIAEELLLDLNKETVNFQPNFDDSLEEPTVLPAKIPNLLMNGTSGIAVGMATNMAPHNLGELIEGIFLYLDDADVAISELIKHVKAPDFPTGGIIYGYNGVRAGLETGRGRVVMRAKVNFETSKSGKDQIVVTEIPYMVNKASMIEKTAQLINDKKIEGISDLRDESDRDGLRVVYDLKRDAIANVVLNNLYKYTQLQSSFSVNNVALVKGRPYTLNLKDLIKHYVEHRYEVITRRTQYDLKEALKRAHILEGFLIALDNLDAVIKTIREARDPETAKNELITSYSFSDLQAKAVLEMRLQRLTGMERDKIVEENHQIQLFITDLKDILANESRRKTILQDELTEIRDKYADKRRTEIVYVADEFTDEDMIVDEQVVFTVSHNGFIKRTSLTEYRTQSRGGTGSRGAKTKTDDFTEHLFIASTHNYLLFFTDLGKIFWLKGYQIPEGSKTAQGRAIQNLIQIEKNDKVRTVINVNNLKDADYINNHYIIMCTKNGTMKKTRLEEFSRPRSGGINAININEGDMLLEVRLTTGNDEILIATDSGRAVRFNESQIRSMGRGATGVRAIRLNPEIEKVVGMVCVSEENTQLLVVSKNGYGKRSEVSSYRIARRGGKGVRTLNISEKTGKVVAINDVIDTDDLMIICKSGMTIRMSVANLRIMGRATQGVKLIRLGKGDEIASITKIAYVEGEEKEPSDLDALVPLEAQEVLEDVVDDLTDDLVDDADDVLDDEIEEVVEKAEKKPKKEKKKE